MNEARQHSNPKYSVHVKIKVIKICSVDVRAYDLGKPFLKIFGFPAVRTKNMYVMKTFFYGNKLKQTMSMIS